MYGKGEGKRGPEGPRCVFFLPQDGGIVFCPKGKKPVEGDGNLKMGAGKERAGKRCQEWMRSGMHTVG